MGGDNGPQVPAAAALLALEKYPELTLVLVGDRERLSEQLQLLNGTSHPRLRIHHASQQIAMDESPAVALRTKKDSSMRVAINLVKNGEVQACVSAGNTGALMATARFVLKTLPGIDRPAILSAIPTTKDGCMVRMLDLGANVDSQPEHFLQFAIMASVVTTAIDGVERPTVGLLNNGTEAIKGNEQVRQAAKLLSLHPGINYIGFVEGDAVYSGIADIIVCDGFIGNIMLKSSEGVAKLVLHYLKQAFKRNWLTRLSGLAALWVLKTFAKKVDPSRYNGASMVGLRGIVIKSHGSADVLAFGHAIDEAVLEADRNIPQMIHEKVARLLQEESGS